MGTPTHITHSSPAFPFELKYSNEDDHRHDLNLYSSLVSPNFQASSPYHVFFNSSTHEDPAEYYRPHHQPYQMDNHDASRGGSYDDVETKDKVGSLKLTLWNNKRKDNKCEKNPVKWMQSSKMHKIKGASHHSSLENNTNTCIKLKLENQKPSSPNLETDHSSSNNNTTTNIPVRVCADCNTTKTPLWRSGPKGPKTLCNACGIRQRKARRAMAAAAEEAAANGKTLTTETSSPMKLKVQLKEKITKVNTNHVKPFKKRCKFGVASGPVSSSSTNNAPNKKIGFEDFLINLSNNLAMHRVFPQDEKEAAILLMALSSGLVHG